VTRHGARGYTGGGRGNRAPATPAAVGPGRYCPDRRFPPYAHVPGQTPHPERDPAGHGVRLSPACTEVVEPEAWRGCTAFLYGVDLFNAGFPWEAHEAWEDLWRGYPRDSESGLILGGLIKLAAAAVKARAANPYGVTRNADKAERYVRRARAGTCFGLLPADLRRALTGLDAHAAAAAGALPVWLAPGAAPGATAGLSSGRPPRA
jgi:hypothetical protein